MLLLLLLFKSNKITFCYFNQKMAGFELRLTC